MTFARLLMAARFFGEKCFQILVWRIAFSSEEQLGRALVAPFASKTRFTGDHEVVDEEVAFSRTSRPLITLFRCTRNLMPQDKIHGTTVAHNLMATSSSTAYAVPLLRWRRLFVKLQFVKNKTHRFKRWALCI